MPQLGRVSLEVLSTCHPLLQSLMTEAIKHWDFSVREGHRSIEDQLDHYNHGRSLVKFGYHNIYPSLAVHAIPYPIDWNDTYRFYYLAGVITGIASQMNIPIRWGGNWDRSKTIFRDYKLKDYSHYELYGDEYRGLVNDGRKKLDQT